MFLALVGTFANAQNKETSHTIIVGVGTPILDAGIGFHIGYNPSLFVSEYFAVEGQISYLNTKVIGTFLSGDKGRVHSTNALIGPRVYFTPQDKRVRPYLSVLVGGLYNNEIIDGRTSSKGFGFGYSGGAYVNISQYTFGLSFDAP